MTFPDLTQDSKKLSYQNPRACISRGSLVLFLGGDASQVLELKGPERTCYSFTVNREREPTSAEDRVPEDRGQQHNHGGSKELASSHSNPAIIMTTNVYLAPTVGRDGANAW